MFSHNQKISTNQVKKLLVFDIFSISALMIPKIAVSYGGHDGLLVVILGTLLTFIYATFLIFVANKIGDDLYKKKEFRIFLILYFAKILFTAIFAIVYFAQVINYTLLSDTNYKIIIATLIIVVVYLASKGIEARARVTEILYYIVLVPLVFLLIVGCSKIDIYNITGVFTENASNILQGTYAVFLLYSLIELIIFIMPYVVQDNDKNKINNKSIFKAVFKAITIVGIINLLFFVTTIGMLGQNETGKNLYSAVNMMQIIKFPGEFIKRQDAIMLAFWILSIFTLLSTLVYYLCVITKKLVGGKKHNYYAIPIGILIFLIASLPIDMSELFDYYAKYMVYIGMPQSIIMPLIIMIFKKKEKL